VRVEISRSETEKEKPKGPMKKREAVVEHGPSGLSVHLEPSSPSPFRTGRAAGSLGTPGGS
jgi:hypothetical protein